MALLVLIALENSYTHFQGSPFGDRYIIEVGYMNIELKFFRFFCVSWKTSCCN